MRRSFRACAAAEADRTAALVIWGIRLPRSLLAYAVGAALAVSGALMQGVFRNPMAEPGLLGVSSGAALGAAAAMLLGLQASLLGFSAVSLCAFAGGALAVLLVMGIAGLGRGGLDDAAFVRRGGQFLPLGAALGAFVHQP